MQTESLVNEHSTQNKVIEDLKKKLVKHEEQELKFERLVQRTPREPTAGLGSGRE